MNPSVRLTLCVLIMSVLSLPPLPLGTRFDAYAQETGTARVSAGQEVLTNENIVKMVQVGLASDLIIEKISASQANFDLSTNGLIALKEAKVPDEIIRAMKARQTGAGVSGAAPAQLSSSNTAPESIAQPPSGSNTSSSAPVQFDEAEYLLKAPGQEKAQPVKGMLVFDRSAKAVRFLSGGITQFDISYNLMTSMLYERAAKPRYGMGLLIAWPLIFTKSKKHFLTIQYKPPDGAGQFAIIQLHKKNYQIALATAEAETGKKVERTEER